MNSICLPKKIDIQLSISHSLNSPTRPNYKHRSNSKLQTKLKSGAQARKGTEPRPPCALPDYLFLNFCFFCFKTKEREKRINAQTKLNTGAQARKGTGQTASGCLSQVVGKNAHLVRCPITFSCHSFFCFKTKEKEKNSKPNLIPARQPEKVQGKQPVAV